MNPNLVNDGCEDRLGQLILEYLDALDAGHKLDRAEFLSAHPEFRRDLEAFFDGRDRIERVTGPLRASLNDHCNMAPNRFRGNDQVRAPRAGFSPSAPVLGQLGEFRLLREVGRGGMGIVYEAEQVSLQRRVALKVLPFAAAIDQRRLQRFKSEALAAAHLRHENIVPVFAVGEDRGVHFYAMQFVDGQSLAALIVELRQRSDSGDLQDDERRPSVALDETQPHLDAPDTPAVNEKRPSATAEASISRDLFFGSQSYFSWLAGIGRQAAQALAHAHQMGIVHRDVKPANFMLDLQGQLWITDFGLAQMGGDAGLTLTGELVGTLRYASPEQVYVRSGLVDHRTDIYSLGVTLYELLTLKPAFDGQDRNELLRRIADEEPTPPRTIRPSVPRDLETIVLKAISKEPSERYGTAQEMAADLERFLEHKPVLARRPTKIDYARKWMRRHPSVVAATIVVLLFALVGSLVSTILIRIEQGKAEDAYERERQRANEAESQFLLAKQSVDELLRLSEDELANNPGAESLRRRLLTSVVAYYQEFIKRRRADPHAQQELRETSKRVEKLLADLTALRTGRQIDLAGQPAVVYDLHLDSQQQAKLSELAVKTQAQAKEFFFSMGRLSASERERQAIQQAYADEAELKAILTEPQFKRLQQIGLQADVAEAIREPELAEALRLTDVQRNRVRAIEEEIFFEGKKRSQNDGGPAESPASRMSKQKNEKNQRILALFTDEQLQKWTEVTGPPVREPIWNSSPKESSKQPNPVTKSAPESRQ